MHGNVLRLHNSRLLADDTLKSTGESEFLHWRNSNKKNITIVNRPNSTGKKSTTPNQNDSVNKMYDITPLHDITDTTPLKIICK